MRNRQTLIRMNYFLLAPVSLLLIINPISLVPIFLGMTPENAASERVRMARLACVIAWGLLIAFALAGEPLIRVLGISVSAFQVAGGILLFLIGLDMLQAEESTRKITTVEKEEGVRRDDIAVTPLAIPLMAGPGAISTTILLQSQAVSWWEHLYLLAIITAVFLVTFGLFRLTASGAAWINPLVLRVTRRLMGLLLAALAVQFVFNGVQAAGFGGS